MLIASTQRHHQALAPKPTPKTVPPQTTRSATEWVDVIKQRSTLSGLVEPLGVTVGLVSNAGENLGTLSDAASALFQGDLGGVGDSVSDLVETGYNPNGVGGAIYNSALGIKTASGVLVGGLEVYAGIKNDDKYLTMMGVADLVGASSHGARIADLDGVAFGLSVASTMAKTALVVLRPDDFSRTQKVKTILDSSGSVASAMLKSGFLVMPALGVSAVAGFGQIAYMNNEAFRSRVDAVLDRIFGPDKPQ